MSGETLGSFALSEPEVGSDPGALQTRAERHGDAWVLNGAKRFIGNAGLSDVYVVFARTGDDGAEGISAFLVDGHADGVSSEPLRDDGHAGLAARRAALRGRRDPGRRPDRPRGRRLPIAMATFDRSRPTVAAQAVGLGQGAIDLAVDYATRRAGVRQAADGPPGHAVQARRHGGRRRRRARADLPGRHRVDEDDPRLTKLAAMAKMMASDAAMRVTTEAVQVLGGNGYLKDFPAERMMRDAKVLQIYEGANEIQRLVIARAMAKQAAEREPMWPECMPPQPSIAESASATAR